MTVRREWFVVEGAGDSNRPVAAFESDSEGEGTFSLGPDHCQVTGSSGVLTWDASSGKIACCFSGRLDATEDLARRLALPPGGSTDAALVIAAYSQYGTRGLAHLVGEFALVLWCASTRTLVAYQDPVGVRRVHYQFAGAGVRFASDLRRLPLRGIPPNPEWIDGLLRGTNAGAEGETAYAGVFRLPPGHCGVSEPGRGLRLEHVRQPGDHAPDLGRLDSREVAGQLGTLLRTAVHDRLRGARKTAVLVSGGVDSALLARLCSDAAPSGRDVSFASAVFPSHPSADERDWIHDVSALCGCPRHLIVDSDDCVALAEVERPFPHLAVAPDASVIRALDFRHFDMARQLGATDLMAGVWADQVFLAWAYRSADFWRGLPLTRRMLEWPWFLRHGFTVAQQKWRGTRGTRPGVPDVVVSAKLPGLHRRALANRLASLDLYGSTTGVAMTHPYLDIRVLDFVAALPVESHAWLGRNKVHLRRAATGMLPDRIRNRRSHTVVNGLVVEGLRRHGARCEAMLRRGALVRSGLLSNEEVSSMMNGGLGAVRRLAAAVGTEIWLSKNDD